MPNVSDQTLLDWLETLSKPRGFGWLLRRSSTGRGWRLLTTSHEPNYRTPRAALQAAFEDCAREMEALDKILGDPE